MKFAIVLLALALGASAAKVAPLPIPTITIWPGVHMPLQGLGTWLYNDTRAEAAVELALSLGYTHVDTAFDYTNSAGIGRALATAKAKYGRDRESYFITTKVEGALNYSHTLWEHEDNLAKLGVDYVDLLLVHFPSNVAANPPTGSAANRQEQWRAMEALYKQGKARAIGVSHYCKHHMEDILAIAEVKPAVNQVQYHVGMGPAPANATDDKPWDATVGVHFESFSPLCGPCTTADGKKDMELITGDLVTGIGAKYNVSGAQVSLRWLVQQGIPVVPKTDKKEHLIENADLFSWSLSDEDMATLSASKVPAVAGASPTDSGDCGLP